MINHRTIGAFLIALTTLGVAEACAQNHRRQRVKTHENDGKKKADAQKSEEKSEEKSSEEASEDAAENTDPASPQSPDAPAPPDPSADDDGGDAQSTDDGGDAQSSDGGSDGADGESADGGDASKAQQPEPLYHWGVTGRAVQSIPVESMPIARDVKLFYATGLGLFPKVVTVNDVRKGGVPQAADLDAHLEEVRADVERRIPDPNWDGYAVINYEEWFGRPIWDAATEDYKAYSRLLIKRENPWRSPHAIEAAAREAYETAAREFITETMRVCKEMRPKTKWGFFLYFPHFKLIDELDWVWELSDAFYPSIYLPYYSVDHRDADRPWEQPSWVNRKMVKWRLGEFRKIAGDRPVLAFAQTQYHGTNPRYGKQEFNEIDREISIELPLEAGADGVIFWQNIQTEQAARELEQRLMNRFVPDMRRIAQEAAAQP